MSVCRLRRSQTKANKELQDAMKLQRKMAEDSDHLNEKIISSLTKTIFTLKDDLAQQAEEPQS